MSAPSPDREDPYRPGDADEPPGAPRRRLAIVCGAFKWGGVYIPEREDADPNEVERQARAMLREEHPHVDRSMVVEERNAMAGLFVRFRLRPGEPPFASLHVQARVVELEEREPAR